MGGPVPLGYEVKDRKLVVQTKEAEQVRHIVRRYLALGSVPALAEELECEGYRTKVQRRASGPHKGGCLYCRGTLYHLLANPIYRGMIVHKGKAHPGEHKPIVDEQLFEQVQAKLADNASGVLPAQEASPAKPAHRQAVRRGRSCDDAKPCQSAEQALPVLYHAARPGGWRTGLASAGA